MKKGIKIFLTVALICIIGGLCLVFAGFAATGFDPTGFVNAKLVSNSYSFDINDFDSISVDISVQDLRIVRSDTEGNTVTVNTRFEENANVNSTVEVIDGSLSVIEREIKWYHKIHIFSSKQTVEIILPKNFSAESIMIDIDTGDTVIESVEARSLKLEGDTGDVRIASSDITNVSIELDTGDVEIKKLNASILKIDNDTGELDITDSAVTDKVNASTETGDVEIGRLNANTLSVETDTGDVSIEETILTGKLTVSTDTGDIDFESSDAAEIDIRSDTGDVDLYLLSAKIFDVDSVTGRVRVPPSGEGGVCKIRTSTGDIEVKVK